MKRPNPHGRSILLTAGGAPATEQPTPAPLKQEQRSPRPWRSGIPLHRGAVSDAEARRLDAEGLRRREGNAKDPSWQTTLRAGCTGCMARPGLLPADHETARRMMLEWGWVFSAGRWLCPACSLETERNHT